MLDATQTIAVLSLVTAITVAVVGFWRNSKHDAQRTQKFEGKVDMVLEGVSELKDTVNRMDAKLDKHDGAIVRLETRLDEHDRRLDHIEGRCERHFGASTHK